METNPEGSEPVNPYEGYILRKYIKIIILAVVIVAISLYSLMRGDYEISFTGVINALFGNSSKVVHVIVWDVRLTRIVTAILVGFALSISGVVMQSILKNPLASPYTLGISNAAAFGAALSLAASYFGWFAGNAVGDFLKGAYGMATFSFVFSMVIVVIILMVSRLTGFTSESLVLMGVAIGSIFSAALASLQYMVDDSTLSSIVYWQFGDLTKAVWSEIGIIFVVTALVICYFFYRRLDFNVMNAGEDVAQSLGLNTRHLLVIGMVLSAVCTSVCISIVGIIGFVGLLGPHISRNLVGGDHRFLMPMSMLVGAAILLFADTIGRLAFTFSLPVGIITSFFGGPLFVSLLVMSHRRGREND
jgi:iron complex transport system permease protein